MVLTAAPVAEQARLRLVHHSNGSWHGEEWVGALLLVAGANKTRKKNLNGER